MFISCVVLSISFNPDPKVRNTFWTLTIGGAFTAMPVWTVSQTAVQRFLAIKSFKLAKRYKNMCDSISIQSFGTLVDRLTKKTKPTYKEAITQQQNEFKIKIIKLPKIQEIGVTSLNPFIPRSY